MARKRKRVSVVYVHQFAEPTVAGFGATGTQWRDRIVEPRHKVERFRAVGWPRGDEFTLNGETWESMGRPSSIVVSVRAARVGEVTDACRKPIP